MSSVRTLVHTVTLGISYTCPYDKVYSLLLDTCPFKRSIDSSFCELSGAICFVIELLTRAEIL